MKRQNIIGRNDKKDYLCDCLQNGLVVQRIEQAFPKRSIGVRFPSGLQKQEGMAFTIPSCFIILSSIIT